MNDAINAFKKLNDDEAEYLFDLMKRCLVKCSQCMSSTDSDSTKLGIESRLARQNIMKKFERQDEGED